MNKKYLTFLSAILISTISACGGSQSGDAPRHQEEPKSDPAPQPERAQNPAPEFRAMGLDVLNEELKNAGANTEFSALSEDVQKSVKHYVSNGHKFVKSKVEVPDADMGPVGTFHVLSSSAINTIEQGEAKWTDIYEEFSL